MKHIVLTGGGTAGHVTPNIAGSKVQGAWFIRFPTSVPTKESKKN